MLCDKAALSCDKKKSQVKESQRAYAFNIIRSAIPLFCLAIKINMCLCVFSLCSKLCFLFPFALKPTFFYLSSLLLNEPLANACTLVYWSSGKFVCRGNLEKDRIVLRANYTHLYIKIVCYLACRPVPWFFNEFSPGY